MSYIVVIVMEILWSLNILVVLLSVNAAHSHKGLRGLSCVNDFVRNVSCTWNGSLSAHGDDCWISSLKKTRILRNSERIPSQMIRTCQLKQNEDSTHGCSFVFENEVFNPFKDLSYISMVCNGTVMENLTNYKPVHHIKMHPPSVLNISSTVNDTWISWTAGSPVSIFITAFDFEVHIKEKTHTWRDADWSEPVWLTITVVKTGNIDSCMIMRSQQIQLPHKEAMSLYTAELQLKLPSQKLKGHHQVRVRVCPTNRPNSHWSDWSPAASWVGATGTEAPSQDQEWLLNKTSIVIQGVVLSFGLIFVFTLVICSRCMRRGVRKKKPVPNPSKYFQSLHSVHGGNLKTWLNPLSASESFFTAQPCDHISPVEMCETQVPSTSPSSRSSIALFHFNSYPSVGLDTSGVADNSSSSSSSCFSNMGYFLSSSSGGSARADPCPAYFTYRDDVHNLHNSQNLHLSLWPSIITSPTYESLRREPQSPDSGFGIGKEDEEDKEDKKVAGVEEEEVLDNCQTTPLLILPLHLPSRMCPPSSLPPTANAPSLTLVSSDSQQEDTAVAPANGSYTAWPMAGAMCRSSSMPVEPSKTGYLTLKELQTTFSNKSI